MGSEDKNNIEEKTSFGIFSNHRYDFLGCEKHNESLFFSLWNPHGNNKLEGNKNNQYQGFDEINKRNEEGLYNGNIILSFDRFFLSFKRMIYQNRDELFEMYKKYKSKGVLDYLGTPYMRLILMMLFGPDINFIISLLLIRASINKGKSSKEILSDLLDEIKKDDNIEEEKMDRLQFLWFLSIWNDVKKDIIKESEDIMIRKSKSNLNTKDKEEIVKILIQENENKNEFIIIVSKRKIKI